MGEHLSAAQADILNNIPEAIPKLNTAVAKEFISRMTPVTGNTLEEVSKWYSDTLVKASGIIDNHENRIGLKSVCHRGCDNCCRGTLITVSYPEAAIIVRYISTNFTKEQIIQLGVACIKWEKAIKKAGIKSDAITTAQQKNLKRFYELREEYNHLNLICPFLNNGECTIHSVRPLDCFEYRQYCTHAFCKKEKPICTTGFPDVKQQIIWTLEKRFVGSVPKQNLMVFEPLVSAIQKVICTGRFTS